MFAMYSGQVVKQLRIFYRSLNDEEGGEGGCADEINFDNENFFFSLFLSLSLSLFMQSCN